MEWCGGGVWLKKFLGDGDSVAFAGGDRRAFGVVLCCDWQIWEFSRDVVLESRKEVMMMVMMMIVTTIQDIPFLPHLRHISHYKSSDCSIYISLYRSAYLTLHSLVFSTRAYKQHII